MDRTYEIVELTRRRFSQEKGGIRQARDNVDATPSQGLLRRMSPSFLTSIVSRRMADLMKQEKGDRGRKGSRAHTHIYNLWVGFVHASPGPALHTLSLVLAFHAQRPNGPRFGGVETKEEEKKANKHTPPATMRL